MSLQQYDKLFDYYYNTENPNDAETMDKVCQEAKFIFKNCKDEFLLYNQPRTERIILSITSIPERLESVVYPIQSMMIQTEKPDKIILWLGNQKLNDEMLPQELVDLKQYGLEICYVEDIGPHTKYFYAMKSYPNDIIITIDDDLLYQRTLIEGLMEGYRRNRNCVCAYWVWEMRFSRHGIPYPSSEYKVGNEQQNDKPCNEFAALGFGGVLYPPHCLHSSAFDVEKIRSLAFKADDVWLKAMEILNNVQVVKVAGRQLYPHITGSQDIALQHENLTGRNDIIIKKVFQHYNIMQHFNMYEKTENNKINTLLKWVGLYQNHFKLSDYLLERNIDTVAIYGMGQLGGLMLDELHDSGVQVLYGIDKKVTKTFGKIPVIKPEAVKDIVDLVIVTAPVSYHEISQYIKSDMISLEDLLVEMKFYTEE